MNKGTKKHRCIACLGKGFVNRIETKKTDEKTKREILKLYRKGIGFREIARRLKIKSPFTVQYFIRRANNI